MLLIESIVSFYGFFEQWFKMIQQQVLIQGEGGLCSDACDGKPMSQLNTHKIDIPEHKMCSHKRCFIAMLLNIVILDHMLF